MAANKKPGITQEMVAEARIKRIIEEEKQIETADTEVQQLKQTTKDLIQKMEEARDAGDEEARREWRNEIVVKNLRLVTQVLKKYGYFSQDKFQNGCIGLLKAAETYRTDKEGSQGTTVPFGNYAAWCIETEIRLAYKRENRVFDEKNKSFLLSIDEEQEGKGGDLIDRHEMIADPSGEQNFEALLEEAKMDTLFYDIIIPCIEEYGTRSKGSLDLPKWRKLEMQYFLELSMESNQQQRLTFTEMATQLNSVPQAMRARHQKVLKAVQVKCEEMGYKIRRIEKARSYTFRAGKEEVQDDQLQGTTTEA